MCVYSDILLYAVVKLATMYRRLASSPRIFCPRGAPNMELNIWTDPGICLDSGNTKLNAPFSAMLCILGRDVGNSMSIFRKFPKHESRRLSWWPHPSEKWSDGQNNEVFTASTGTGGADGV